MTSKHSLQNLTEQAQHYSDQARNLQNVVKKLNSVRKDQEIKQHQEILQKFLLDLEGELKDFQEKISVVQAELNVALGTVPEESDPSAKERGQTSSQNDKGKKRLRNPEDQETAYQLKARMMPQYKSKNNALHAEMVLVSRRNDLRAQRNFHQVNYNRDTNLSAVTTLRCLQGFEKRAVEAEKRADNLQRRLDELEGPNNSAGGKKEPESSQTLLGPNNRVNDIIKKNEVLKDENSEQRLEIQRLKRDNAELIKQTKHAEQDKHHLLSQLNAVEMSRRDIHTRLQKQKAEHNRVSRSLTKQSTDLIEARKQQNQLEEELRFRNVGHVAPHGAYERTYMHPVTKNVDQPRYMFPVQRFAETKAA